MLKIHIGNMLFREHMEHTRTMKRLNLKCHVNDRILSRYRLNIRRSKIPILNYVVIVNLFRVISKYDNIFTKKKNLAIFSLTSTRAQPLTFSFCEG